MARRSPECLSCAKQRAPAVALGSGHAQDLRSHGSHTESARSPVRPPVGRAAGLLDSHFAEARRGSRSTAVVTAGTGHDSRERNRTATSEILLAVAVRSHLGSAR